VPHSWNLVGNLTGPAGPTGPSNSWRTTFASFTIPVVGSTVAVTVAATADFVVGQRHVLTDGTLYVWAAVASIASLVVTYTNLATPGGAVSGSMGAGRVYMATGGPILGTAALLNVPASGNATSGQVVLGTDTRLSDARALLGSIAESAVTNLTTDLAAKLSATDPSVTNARTPTAHGSSHLSTDPSGGTSHYYDYEDFIGVPKLGAVQNSGGAGALSFNYLATLPLAHQGALNLCPGTATGQYARYFLNPLFLNTGITIILRSIIEVQSALTAAQIFFGLCDQPGPIIDSSHNYIGFLFNPNSVATDWASYTRAAASVTGPTDCGVAAVNTWVDLKLIITPTSIGFYCNGVLKDTKTTTIPAAGAALNPCIFVASNTLTSAPSILVDTFEIDVDSGLAGKFLKAAI
jgi:hypothetical protein